MIGKIIKEKREELGLSQNEIAEYLSISPQSVSKWEREIAEPSIEYLPQLAKIFNCSIDNFFELEKYSGDNLNLSDSLFIKLSKEGKFDESKKHLLLNSNEFDFIKTLFGIIENKIKLGEECFTCKDIQENFNFGYFRAKFIIDWLIDLGILERIDNGINWDAFFNQERFYKIQSALID